MPTRPTMPLMRNSQPANSATAIVATMGSPMARKPSRIMIRPWIRNSTQWRRIASRGSRASSFGRGSIAVMLSS
jgi:hypothetical protein